MKPSCEGPLYRAAIGPASTVTAIDSEPSGISDHLYDGSHPGLPDAMVVWGLQSYWRYDVREPLKSRRRIGDF
jgi:hypothetical protein